MDWQYYLLHIPSTIYISFPLLYINFLLKLTEVFIASYLYSLWNKMVEVKK